MAVAPDRRDDSDLTTVGFVAGVGFDSVTVGAFVAASIDLVLIAAAEVPTTLCWDVDDGMEGATFAWNSSFRLFFLSPPFGLWLGNCICGETSLKSFLLG